MSPPADKPLPRMTVDQFIEWAMEQPRGRFELLDGEVIAMAPERARHALTKQQVALTLRDAVRKARLDCTVFPDGMTVVIDQWTSFEPDAVVQCGVRIDPEQVTVDRPLIVVEVVSPSTRHLDAGMKLHNYFRLDSIVHYLIVDSKKPVLIHHRHAVGADSIETRILRDGQLRLDPPGIEVAVRDLFIEEEPVPDEP
jgi:Uma2 family endonuclease